MDTRTLYWNLLIVGPLEGGLRFIALDLHLGAALSIVLFTVAVRVLLFPLTARQFHTQRALAALRPELDALHKRHAKDQARLARETGELYRTRGVHPAGGVLPLLIQMPVLFGLYAALRNLGLHEPAFQSPWLWLASLQRPDTWLFAGYVLPGPLPILAAVTQWVQLQLSALSVSADPTSATGQRTPGWQAAIGPLMMLWFGLSVSAGLALYWVTQNLIGTGQRFHYERLHSSHRTRVGTS